MQRAGSSSASVTASRERVSEQPQLNGQAGGRSASRIIKELHRPRE
jgi:hypothetical protein